MHQQVAEAHRAPQSETLKLVMPTQLMDSPEQQMI